MKALSAGTYAALRSQVSEVLLTGQRKIEEAKVRTYWETGRLINEYLRKAEVPYQERGGQVRGEVNEIPGTPHNKPTGQTRKVRQNPMFWCGFSESLMLSFDPSRP